MNPLLLWTEVFYSPKSFFFLRKDDKKIHFFLAFFPLLAYAICTATIFRFFGLQAKILSFVFMLLAFYVGGFLKACLYTAVLNAKKPIASLKDMWLAHCISLFPFIIFMPFISIFSAFKSVFLVGFLSIALYMNFFKISLIKRYYNKKAGFVWIISLCQIIFLASLFLILIGIGLMFAGSAVKEIIKAFMIF